VSDYRHRQLDWAHRTLSQLNSQPIPKPQFPPQSVVLRQKNEKPGQRTVAQSQTDESTRRRSAASHQSGVSPRQPCLKQKGNELSLAKQLEQLEEEMRAETLKLQTMMINRNSRGKGKEFTTSDGVTKKQLVEVAEAGTVQAENLSTMKHGADYDAWDIITTEDLVDGQDDWVLV
jgi:hypothetical protein